MSTKTTFKRVALVAVAALGLGVLTSVAPASAATATSAMRLKDVFVDICFLSTSQEQEFPALGLGGKCLLICHERVFFTRFERQCHWYEKSD